MRAHCLAALIFVAISPVAAASEIRDISRYTPASKSVERASECLAFIETVKIYGSILRGLPIALGQDVSELQPQLEWVWSYQTRQTTEAAKMHGATVNYDLATDYVHSFGPVGGRSLLLNRPAYINNVRVCRDELKAQYDQ